MYLQLGRFDMYAGANPIPRTPSAPRVEFTRQRLTDTPLPDDEPREVRRWTVWMFNAWGWCAHAEMRHAWRYTRAPAGQDGGSFGGRLHV
jgi:hypothetical protein